MKSVGTMLFLDEAICRTFWITDPIVECFDVFLVSGFSQVRNVLFKSLSFGIGFRTLTLVFGLHEMCWLVEFLALHIGLELLLCRS